MSIATGIQAPDFTLFDSDKQQVTLSALQGKNVVLLFFPLAFTGTCTAELCSVRDNIATYNNTNAVVLGISVDSLFTLEKYKAEQNLNFSLLKSLSKEKFKFCSALYFSSVNKLSTEMPNTTALVLL